MHKALAVLTAGLGLALPVSAFAAPAKAPVKAAAPATPAPVNRPPVIETLPFTDWQVGKQLHFGIHALDPDDDGVRIEVLQKPLSATYNELTQTVSWKPTAKDGSEGRFRVRVTEVRLDRGVPVADAPPRFVTREFAIRLTKGALAPQPQVKSAITETLITIRDPDRLAEARKKYSLAKVLDLIGQLEIKRETLAGRDAKLYGNPKAQVQLDLILKLMARLNKNPTLDPDSDKYNPEWGKFASWQLVTVRPRMNKARHELRLVYRNMTAPETAYIMFRVALASDMPDVPLDVRAESNVAFTGLLYDSFFVGETLDPKLVTDKKAYGRALVGFLDKFFSYDDAAHKRLYPQMLALPISGRLGAGSVTDGAGKYLWGNGWSWITFKNTWGGEQDGKKMGTYFAPPIKGFTGDVVSEGNKWVSKCIAELPADYCRVAEGFSNIPQDPPKKGADGILMGVLADAQQINPTYKALLSKRTRLDDATRRNFEENGMSCAQCHVRAFDEGDVLDPGIWDPSKKTRPTLARPLPQTFFVLVPEFRNSPFLDQQELDTECLLGPMMSTELGKSVKVPCAPRGE